MIKKTLLIERDPHQTRVAVLENDRLAEVVLERHRQRGLVGNLYKGRVTRVLPGMQAAFVDCGLERDAFLYVSDAVIDDDGSMEGRSERDGGGNGDTIDDNDHEDDAGDEPRSVPWPTGTRQRPHVLGRVGEQRTLWSSRPHGEHAAAPRRGAERRRAPERRHRRAAGSAEPFEKCIRGVVS